MRVTDDGASALNDVETITVKVGKAGQITDLGTVDFLVQEELSLTEGSLFFSLTTAHPGFLTLETIKAGAWESARIHLYDVNPQQNPSATPQGGESQLVGGNARNDWTAEQEQQYFIGLYGDNSDVDLRIANLVHHERLAEFNGTGGSETLSYVGVGNTARIAAIGRDHSASWT